MIILDKYYSECSCWHYLRKKLVTVWSHNVALNSTLTLLVGQQERHPACRNWVVRYWHGYLCGARCKWFAYGPADATVTPSSLAAVKSRMVYLSGAGLPRLSWRKGRYMDVVGWSSSWSRVESDSCLLKMVLIGTLQEARRRPAKWWMDDITE